MGVLPVGGHDEGNDSLFSDQQASADARRNRMFAWGQNPGQPYDPNAAAGDPGSELDPNSTGAAQDVNRYREMGSLAMNRPTYQIDYNQAAARGEQADYDRLNAQYARGAQTDALRLQQQAAYGLAPSVAQIQMQQGLDQAMRGQQSLAASARGPAALALAQQQAAANTANIQQQGVNQSAALRAGEMAQARDAYMGGASGIRAQDYQGQGLSLQGQQIENQAAQAQGQLDLGQRALNQQGQLGFEGMAMGVNQSQLNASMQQQALEEGHWAGQAALDQHRTDSDANWGGKIIGGILGSDPRMKMGARSELNPRAEAMGTYPPWMPPFPVPSAENGAGRMLLTSDPRSKLNPRAEAMGTYPADILEAFPVPSSASHGGIPLLTSDPDSKQNVLSSPLSSMGGMGMLGMLTSDPKAKEQARQEGAAQMARTILAPPERSAHSAFYPRANATDAEAMAQAQQMARGAAPAAPPPPESPEQRNARLLDAAKRAGVVVAGASPMAGYGGAGTFAPAVQAGYGGLGALAQGQPQVAGAGAGRALAPPPPAQPPQASAQLTSDPRAKQNAYEEGLMAAARRMGQSISGEREAMQFRPAYLQGAAARDRSAPMGETAPQQMGRAIVPSSYNYKPGANPADDGRRNYGVMTTDLEKTPMGRSLVEKGAAPGGYDAINVPKATGALLAQNADQQKQIDDLKFGRDARMGPDPTAGYNPNGPESVYGDDPEVMAARDQYMRNSGRGTWGSGIDREYPDAEPGSILAKRRANPYDDEEDDRVWR